MDKKNISPFVKWAGGKRQLIEQIEKRLPEKFIRYYEPFVGGGALFMHLNLKDVVVNDISKELINAYTMIKNNPVELMEKLDYHEKQHKLNPKEYFYYIRSFDRNENEWKKVDDLDKAARLIYLNKSCFNGLYRVNSKGQFNVPFNQKSEVKTYEKDNIINLSEYLNKNNVVILCGDFEAAVSEAKKGDFIYFDPPYDLLKVDTFDSYTVGGFGTEGQIRLAKLFRDLHDKGCYVMLSNHDTPLIRELYKDFYIDEINVKRMINANANNRNGKEVIICNYKNTR